MNLCMSTKLKYTYLKRYACSKLAQQRLMRQGGPRVTHDERPAAFLSTLSHCHSHKKQMNLVQVCHASTLSRLGQRQISSSMVQDFVEYFCAMSEIPGIFALVLRWSTHTSIGTHVASWPSRGLCDKVGPESHIMNAPQCCYRHAVTGTASKSRWILSKYLPCLHSFQGQISCWIVLQDFVEYFCSMSGSPRCIFAWVLSWSTHTSRGTHVASWPSRGLCDKVGPESHMMDAPPHFYRHSVTGTARKSRWILSKYLPCLHSFQARPEADQLLNRSSSFFWIFWFHVRKPKNLCRRSSLEFPLQKGVTCVLYRMVSGADM